MKSLQNFIELNRDPVLFAYGLAYFSAGLAIFLQQRRTSNFRLAHHLWLLGAFGLIHGIADWGLVFIPLQSSYLSEDWISVLRDGQKLSWAVSFAFLLQFGVSIIIPKLSWVRHQRIFVHWGAPVWSASVILISFFFMPAEFDESWLRYLLGFPGALLTAVAFLSERSVLTAVKSPAANINLTITAASFGTYAILSGLISRNSPVPVLSSLNYANVIKLTGFPIQLWRMLLGVVIAVFVIKTLMLFDLEMRNRLEAAEREQALLRDRQRIARDLHDGVVQSIYAAGLQLEVISKSIYKDADHAAGSLKSVMEQLNAVIANMRKFIFKLGQVRTGESDFHEYLLELASEFSENDLLDVRIEQEGPEGKLSADKKQNVVFIARECLNNIVKHAHASHAVINLDYGTEALVLSVEDDGVGFRDDKLPPIYQKAEFFVERSCRGLRSMADRAAGFGGDFAISNKIGSSGTLVVFTIPYDKEED